MGALWFGKSPEKCLQLSNSGKILKLLVPNDNQKIICGWETYSLNINKFNNSCRVISQMIMERKIDNRGSKSIIVVVTHSICVTLQSIVVKEQRVYGSLREKYNTILAPSCSYSNFFNEELGNNIPSLSTCAGRGCFSRLRCTLMSFERNYQIRILSKQKNIQIIRLYFTKVQESFIEKQNLSSLGGINPWFITGFVDGEGCFLIKINRNEELKIDWNVQLCFQIGLHRKDKSLLEQIKKYFNVGSITKQGSESYQYRVSSVKDLNIIINHFNKFPLITKKRADFLLLMRVIELMERREHLTLEGLHKIVAIKASMNLGLSEKLRAAFPDVAPVVRPKVENPKIPDPNWLAGFTFAEGCFFLGISESKTKIGYRVQVVFVITQHSRDEKLLRSFISYLNCGNVYKKRDTFNFEVYKFSDITDKIIPFFKKYPIRGVKALDFDDWCEVAEMMKKKEHLTSEGLEKIKKIKARMNTGRKFS